MLMLAMLLVVCASAAAQQQADGGERQSLKDCTVTVAANAGPGERFAAEELALFGGNISNGNVPLVVDIWPATQANRPCTIAVGYTAAIAAGVTPALPASLVASGNKNEGYLIASPVITGKPGSWAVTGAVRKTPSFRH